jgi:hypothetical protein
MNAVVTRRASVGRSLRLGLAALVLLACECGGTGLPPALSSYGEAYEVTPFTGWSVPGLRLYHVRELGLEDASSTSVVGVDEQGALVEGSDLFARFSTLPPEELAQRACIVLIDGCRPLDARDPSAAMWGDASRVTAPHLDEGHLVFFIVEGDMAPRVVRITIDVAAGAVIARDALADLAPAGAATSSFEGSIHVTLAMPGPDAARFVTATLEQGPPLAVFGCVSSVSGACRRTTQIELDHDAGAELDALVTAVRAIPRCEPEAIVPGDREYTLTLDGAPREYTGHLPAAEAELASRDAGPCRADARLAWWVARWIASSSRAPSEQPSTVAAQVNVSGETGPSFVNATVDLAATPLAVFGCTSAAAGSCRATTSVDLDAAQRARLLALVEDVRAEPSHEPFPAGQSLSLATGIVYDGPCGADAALAWWLAGVLDPTAMSRGSASE